MMLTLNRRSWHYRWMRLMWTWNGWRDDDPTDLCTYVRMVMLCGLMFSTICVLVGVLIGYGLFTLLYIAYLIYLNLLRALIVLALSVGIGVLGMILWRSKWVLAQVYVQAKRQGVCPRVEYKE